MCLFPRSLPRYRAPCFRRASNESFKEALQICIFQSRGGTPDHLCNLAGITERATPSGHGGRKEWLVPRWNGSPLFRFYNMFVPAVRAPSFPKFQADTRLMETILFYYVRSFLSVPAEDVQQSSPLKICAHSNAGKRLEVFGSTSLILL